MSQQPALFVRADETLDGVPVPRFDERACRLEYESHLQRPTGFGSDPDDPPYEVFSVTLPASSGVFQAFTDRNGEQQQMPFRITTTDWCTDEATLVNAWLKKQGNKDTPAGKWIVENADELNQARRYWGALRAAKRVTEQELRIAEMQDELRRMKINANIAIVEVKEGKWSIGDDRKRLAAEFGATEEDIK